MNRAYLVVAGILLWAALLATAGSAAGDVHNLKVVTDASPDYTDMPSMIRSITGKWASDQEKLWALFYWNHIARRQTIPMVVHGLAVSDPIRQFNDYGYMMCSTISGALCGTWHNMGYEVKYYDLPGHTVHYLLSDKPMSARYVRYKVRHPDFFCPSELLVREFIRYEPFDLKIALPNEDLPK